MTERVLSCMDAPGVARGFDEVRQAEFVVIHPASGCSDFSAASLEVIGKTDPPPLFLPPDSLDS